MFLLGPIVTVNGGKKRRGEGTTKGEERHNERRGKLGIHTKIAKIKRMMK